MAKNKQAIILGATRGLGKEIASIYGKKGVKTVEVGSTIEEANDPSRIAIRADLSNLDETKKLAKKLGNIVGNADETLFYWVAGKGYVGDFAKQSSKNVQNLLDVNLRNALLVLHEVWVALQQNGQSSEVCVIASTTGQKARTNEAVYAAVKHAQVGFARSLGLESERLGLKTKVSLFMPGGMKTEFWKGNEPENFSEFLDPKKVAQYVVNKVEDQSESYYEETIERGSL